MSLRRITSLTSLGAALEYYDFVIYATLSHVLSQLFFPSDNPQLSLLKTFAIFGIGYLVRPLGGVVIGTFGDRFGRKNVFIFSISLMACSTLCIGLLPTYAQIGIAAPIALILCRICQGISFGAELPGAITFLTEHAHAHRPAIHIAWMIAGVSVGALMSSGLYTLLTYVFGIEQILQYAWRIPFILGGCLGLAAYFLRKNTLETPMFNKEKAYAFAWPLMLNLFKQHLLQIIMGISVTLLGGTLIISYLYLPIYLHTQNPTSASLAFTLGFLWSVILIPSCGWLTDSIGLKRTLTLALLFMAVMSYPMMILFKQAQFLSLLLFALLYQTITSLLAVNYTILLSRIFPIEVRYTGIALCYNTAFALAGLTPIGLGLIMKMT